MTMYTVLTAVLFVLSVFMLVVLILSSIQWYRIAKKWSGDGKELTEHVIYTRVNFTLLFFSVGLMGFILAYGGYNVKTQFENEMKDTLTNESHRISKDVIKGTNDTLRRVFEISIDTLLRKSETIATIVQDVENQKQRYEGVVRHSLLLVDSLKRIVAKTRIELSYVQLQYSRDVGINTSMTVNRTAAIDKRLTTLENQLKEKKLIE